MPLTRASVARITAILGPPGANLSRGLPNRQ